MRRGYPVGACGASLALKRHEAGGTSSAAATTAESTLSVRGGVVTGIDRGGCSGAFRQPGPWQGGRWRFVFGMAGDSSTSRGLKSTLRCRVCPE